MGTTHLTMPPETSERFERLLREAAAGVGIEPEYWDIWGRHHATPAGVQLEILRSLGVPCWDEASLESYLEERYEAEWGRPVPPALILGSAEPEFRPEFHLRHAARVGESTPEGEVLIHLEDGRTVREPLDLDVFPVTRTRESRAQMWWERRVRLVAALPWGYHRMVLRLGRQFTECRLILCPDRAWLPERLDTGGRTAGVAISLYGVRSDRNWGCGDFTDLKPALDWLRHDVHGSFLALNPLHAIDNRQPYNISPYLPASSLYRNPLYLDIEAVPEFADSALAQRLAASDGHRARIEELRQSEFVLYERVWRHKLLYLRVLFRQFLRGGRPERRQAFQAFQAREGERLRRFSLFRALWEWRHRLDRNVWIWSDWPAAYQDPDSPEVAAFEVRYPRAVLFHQYVQWLVDEQLEGVARHAASLGLPVGLYHDLALATDKYGADVWAYRKYYVAGCRVGSPPDGFAPNGQDWAFPPPHALRLQEDGYGFFVDCIRANARHGGALRIDHVMRLFRLFWIPDGMEASEGAYVRDHAEDLLHLLALESHRGRFFIVGEDLGTVEDRIRLELERFRILSYKVFYFEKDGAGRYRRPEEYARQALVSSTTHDLPTLAGFWTCRDIEARWEAGLLPDPESYQRQKEERAADKQHILDVLHELELLPVWFPRQASGIPELSGELHNAIIGFLVRTPSAVLVLNQEDLTKETEQQNLPASTYQYPNWQRKMRYTLEQLRSDRAAQDFAAMFRHWLHTAERAHNPE